MCSLPASGPLYGAVITRTADVYSKNVKMTDELNNYERYSYSQPVTSPHAR